MACCVNEKAPEITARFGDLAVTVDEEGRTRVRERYVIAAPVAGLEDAQIAARTRLVARA